MSPLKVFRTDSFDTVRLERVVRHLEGGGLLGYPTETVYGLGAAVSSEGVEALSELKGRSIDKPFVVLLPSFGDAAEDGLEWTSQARSLAERHWPGPLTLIVPDSKGRYPRGARNEEGGVAVRLSSSPFVQALMTVWNAPLLSTSANMPGEVPAQTVLELTRALRRRPRFEDLWIADGGPLPSSEPSTIVDCTSPIVKVVREGQIRVEMGVNMASDSRA